jgi:hypothetical protein
MISLGAAGRNNSQIQIESRVELAQILEERFDRHLLKS